MVDLKLVFIFTIIPFFVCEEVPIPDVGKYPTSFLRMGDKGGLPLFFDRTEKVIGRSKGFSSLSGVNPTFVKNDQGLSGLFGTTEKAVDYANGISPLFGQYPWQAMKAFVLTSDDEGIWRCTGILISNRFVLTAAHCVDTVIRKEQVSVTLGEYSLKKAEETEIVPEVKRVIIHPHWKKSGINADIALIEFEKPVQMTKNINNASLPIGPPKIDAEVIAAGWGLTQNNILPDKLRAAELKLIPTDDCEEMIKDQKENEITEGNICAISRTNYDKHATCGGDSGGEYNKASN